MSASREENLEIAYEAERSLNDPRKINPPASGHSGTELADTSGVTDAEVNRFPGGTVQSGRTGVSGGGANEQTIPAEEGGDEGVGSRSGEFEGRGNQTDTLLTRAEQAPGSVNLTNKQREPVPAVNHDPAQERERNLLPVGEAGPGRRFGEDDQRDRLGNTQ